MAQFSGLSETTVIGKVIGLIEISPLQYGYQVNFQVEIEGHQGNQIVYHCSSRNKRKELLEEITHGSTVYLKGTENPEIRYRQAMPFVHRALFVHHFKVMWSPFDNDDDTYTSKLVD